MNYGNEKKIYKYKKWLMVDIDEKNICIWLTVTDTIATKVLLLADIEIFNCTFGGITIQNKSFNGIWEPL